MKVRSLTPQEVRRVGLQALLDSLGPAGTLRFLLQFESGSGDYTRDRQKLIKSKKLDQMFDEIELQRSKRRGKR